MKPLAKLSKLQKRILEAAPATFKALAPLAGKASISRAVARLVARGLIYKNRQGVMLSAPLAPPKKADPYRISQMNPVAPSIKREVMLLGHQRLMIDFAAMTREEQEAFLARQDDLLWEETLPIEQRIKKPKRKKKFKRPMDPNKMRPDIQEAWQAGMDAVRAASEKRKSQVPLP